MSIPFTCILCLHSRPFFSLLSRITLYTNVTTVLTILLTMPVSTATPEQSFSALRSVNTYMRSTTRTQWRALFFGAYASAYRDTSVDTESRVHDFCTNWENSRLAFGLLLLRMRNCLELPRKYKRTSTLLRYGKDWVRINSKIYPRLWIIYPPPPFPNRASKVP